ncbi:MAG: hypothetical protein ACP5FK_01140 [bacterium]
MKRYISLTTVCLLFILFSCSNLVRAPEVNIYSITPDNFVATTTTGAVSVSVNVENNVEARLLKVVFRFLKSDGSSITGVNNVTRYFNSVIPATGSNYSILNAYAIPTAEIHTYMTNNPNEDIILDIHLYGEDAMGYEKEWDCSGSVSVVIE